MSDTKFINGIRAFKPSSNAPDYIKTNLVFNKKELLEFLKDMPEEFKGVMKESKKGTYYLSIDTYEPKPAAVNQQEAEDLPF